MDPSLEVFVPDALWLRNYLVRLGGALFNARMTVIKLRSGEILLAGWTGLEPAASGVTDGNPGIAACHRCPLHRLC
jgi:hypothetical protein